MNKVDEKWFKAQGWEVANYDESDTNDEDIRKRRGWTNIKKVVCRKEVNGSIARYEHVVENMWWQDGTLRSRSNYYIFYAWGVNGFKVEHRCSSRKFTDEQILSALKVVGIE